MAMPIVPLSAIGVSSTRCGQRAWRPRVVRKAPSKTPMSWPISTTDGVALHLLQQGLVDGVDVGGLALGAAA